MTDREMAYIDALFSKWLDSHNNILEIPFKETLGDAWFDAWEKAKQELSHDRVLELFENGEIKYLCASQDRQSCKAGRQLDKALREIEVLKAQIEAMKCCNNCSHDDDSGNCDFITVIQKKDGNMICKNWEIRK